MVRHRRDLFSRHAKLQNRRRGVFALVLDNVIDPDVALVCAERDALVSGVGGETTEVSFFLLVEPAELGSVDGVDHDVLEEHTVATGEEYVVLRGDA